MTQRACRLAAVVAQAVFGLLPISCSLQTAHVLQPVHGVLHLHILRQGLIWVGYVVQQVERIVAARMMVHMSEGFQAVPMNHRPRCFLAPALEPTCGPALLFCVLLQWLLT